MDPVSFPFLPRHLPHPLFFFFPISHFLLDQYLLLSFNAAKDGRQPELPSILSLIHPRQCLRLPCILLSPSVFLTSVPRVSRPEMTTVTFMPLIGAHSSPFHREPFYLKAPLTPGPSPSLSLVRKGALPEPVHAPTSSDRPFPLTPPLDSFFAGRNSPYYVLSPVPSLRVNFSPSSPFIFSCF